MALFDDNNTLSSGSGKDPLTELDDELEQLRLTLDELNAGSADTPSGDIPDAGDNFDVAEDTVAESHDVPRDSYDGEQDKPAVSSRAYDSQREIYSKKPKGPNTAVIAVAAAVALLGVIGGLAFWLLNRPVGDIVPGDTESSVVEVNDPILGAVEVPVVQGASVNTYSADDLVTGDNGLYSYYRDGKKVSEVGVDLSEYQTDIDFAAMKSFGVDFVMLRVGGRYYSDEGGLFSDTAFDSYYEQAKAAGLKVGAYFFSQAASIEDAEEEAEYAVGLLGGKKLDYPLAFDWETIEDDSARTDNVSGGELTGIAAAFCDKVKAGGYRPIVYASTSLMLQSYDFEVMKNYEFWLADYREFPVSERMYYDFTMWQYTTEGTVDGVGSPVDLNLYIM